jgi:hypothetical protein
MMNRTNRGRTRRNKGPAKFSVVADQKLEQKSDDMATGLVTATVDRGSAAAASLLVRMAEIADYSENTGPEVRALSIIERWEREPQVTMMDTDPQIGSPPAPRQLTDGSGDSKEKAEPEILEGEYEIVSEAGSGA